MNITRFNIFARSIVLLVVLFGAEQCAARKDQQKKSHQKKAAGKKKKDQKNIKQQRPALMSDMTIYIHMAGDNNLEPWIAYNANQMSKEGAPAGLNVVMGMFTHRVHEQKQMVWSVLDKKAVNILRVVPDLDSGDKDIFFECMKAAHEEFPSKKFGVILWDHGFGPLNRSARRGICYDGTTGHFLSDNDLRDAFLRFKNECLHGADIDFVGFDACLMASIEIAYTMRDCVRYMIASEETIPAAGWPYDRILRAYKQGSKTPQELGSAIVDMYDLFYSRLTKDYTLSLIDVKKLDPLAENLKSVATLLQSMLEKQKEGTVLAALREAGNETTRFEEASYADIGDWYRQLLLRVDRMNCLDAGDTQNYQSALKIMIAEGLGLVASCVLKSAAGAQFPNSRGMFVYLPQKSIDRAYLTTYWSAQTQWLEFLKSTLVI